jgi:hypothetical protein
MGLVRDYQARAVARIASAALPLVTVRAGDSISAIAASHCGDARDWTGVYAASRRAHLTAWNANDLTTGQQLAVECDQVPGMLDRAPTPSPPPVAVAPVTASVTRPSSDTEGSGGGGRSPAPQAAPAAHRYESAAVSGAGTYHGPAGSYESCVISRESGGNAQIWNPTGHWGLYQFDEQTWVSGGGSPGSFGSASAAEQHQVFARVYAARGTSPLTPSDGC